MVTERQKTILEALVREYVASAEPVSSGGLVRKYRLPHSPATVRTELSELTRHGFIAQPHTSAGRIPTDKGYRFFIEHSILYDNGQGKKMEKSLRPLLDIKDEFDFLRQTSRLIAEFSQGFSMAGFYGRGLLYKSGLAEVLSEQEFEDEAAANEFGELVDFLDEEIPRHFHAEDLDRPRVFIGHENPIPGARNYAMLVSGAATAFDEDGIFAILGPRRMDYEKNLMILNAMSKLFNE